MLNLPKDIYDQLEDLKEPIRLLAEQRNEAERVAAVILGLLEKAAPGSSVVWLESYEWLRRYSIAGAIVHESESKEPLPKMIKLGCVRKA